MTGGGTDTAPGPSQDTGASLSFARAQALAALQVACAPAQRAALEQTIADLDQRIAALTARR